jgi:hypothetical protein
MEKAIIMTMGIGVWVICLILFISSELKKKSKRPQRNPKTHNRQSKFAFKVVHWVVKIVKGDNTNNLADYSDNNFPS